MQMIYFDYAVNIKVKRNDKKVTADCGGLNMSCNLKVS